MATTPGIQLLLLPLNDGATSVVHDPRNSRMVTRLPADGFLINVPDSDRSWPTQTLVTIGQQGTIVVDDSEIGDRHCSFELLANGEIMFEDHSADRSVQTFGRTAVQIQIRRHTRHVLVDENTNRRFGFGGVDCARYYFEIKWLGQRTPGDRIRYRQRNLKLDSMIQHPRDQKRIRFSELIWMGGGISGEVSAVVDVDTGEHLALKRVHYEPGDEWMVEQEADILSSIKHENIVDFVRAQVAPFNPDLEEDEGEIDIFMGLKTGNVNELMRETNHFQNELNVCDLLVQMLKALAHLDANSIIHRDVKPANILYSKKPDGKFLYQLADFGLATRGAEDPTLSGTIRYMAPEVQPDGWTEFNRPAQTPKIDVWALFVTIAEVSNVHRFQEVFPQDPSTQNILNAVETLSLEPRLVHYGRMARRDPSERPSAQAMLDRLRASWKPKMPWPWSP